jgi:hypothetical protein
VAAHHKAQRGRADRRPGFDSIELLESRCLLAYTPLGPIPDLAVRAVSGPIAAYGGPLTLTVQVSNLGSSMGQIEPLAIAPDQPSQADAPPTIAGVYISRFAHRGLQGAVQIGTIDVPAVPQNSNLTITQTFDLPDRPPNFPGSGGKIFVFVRSDDDRSLRDFDQRNDIFRVRLPVRIFAPLPDLTAVALDVPTVMQPGDVIAPAIKVANFGTVNSNLQADVTVLLVASDDEFFGPGDIVVGEYQIDSLPPLAQVPASRAVLGDVNIDDPDDVVVLTNTTSGESTVPLPEGETYFLGVIVDPFNQIRELNELVRPSDGRLQLLRIVSPVPGMTPADTVGEPAPQENVFPVPAFGLINQDGDTGGILQSGNRTVLSAVIFNDAFGNQFNRLRGPRRGGNRLGSR